MLNQREAFIVGVSSFLMMVALSILLIWKSGLALKLTGTQYTAQMNSIGGLLNGAEVRYRGYKVGRITKLLPSPKDIKVQFSVKNGIKMPKDSTVKVTFDGLIGEKYLLILPNENQTEMAKAGDVFGGYPSVGIADFIEVGAANLEHSKDILNTFREVFTSEDVRDSLEETIISMKSMTHDFAGLAKGLNEMAIHNQLGNIQERFVGLLNQFEKASETISKISEKIDRDVMSESNMNNISSITKDISKLSSKLNGFFGDNDEKGSQAIRTMRGLTKMKLYPNGYMMYSIPNKSSVTHLELIMDFDEYHVITGFDDRSETFQLSDLQYSQKLTKQLSSRVGIIHQQPGIGFNYQLFNRINVGVDLYNINKLKTDFFTYIILNPNIAGFVNLRNNTDDNFNNYSVGLKYYMSGFKE